MEAYSGGLDRTVRMHDFATGKDIVLGSHDDAVRAMAFSTANSTWNMNEGFFKLEE
jgi:cell cycle arrest protein BUB3